MTETLNGFEIRSWGLRYDPMVACLFRDCPITSHEEPLYMVFYRGGARTVCQRHYRERLRRTAP